MSFEVKTTVYLYKRKHCHYCPFREGTYCHIFAAFLSLGNKIELGYRRCPQCIGTEKNTRKGVNETQTLD